MGAEMGIHKESEILMRVDQSCPHCGNGLAHERKVLLPIGSAPQFKLTCPGCKKDSLELWLQDPHSFAPMVVLLKLPLNIIS